MQVTEDGTTSKAEQLAHARPAVERWLSWSGLLPLPAFLLLHLGRELWLSFRNDVSDVLRPEPSVLTHVTAYLLVWLPLVVHGALGVLVLLRGRMTTFAGETDVPRLARLMSRSSGALALLFLAYHAPRYAFSVWLGEADARDAGFRLLAELASTQLGVPLRAALYLLGVLAAATHAGLGVHRGLLGEGLLATPARRRASARACAALGALLFAIGAAAVIRVAAGVLVR
jgi:succinate dehydrogenase/fumarate reductase cytochrome b subunit